MKHITDQLKIKISNFIQKSFFRDSFWMLLTKIFGMAIQLAYFILLARYLGSENYGIFEGTKAIWAIVFPFVGIGTGDLLIQDVSRLSQAFAQRWGEALLVSIFSVVVILIFVFPLVILFLPSATPFFIFSTLIADLVGLKLCSLAERAFVANGQVKKAAQYGMIYNISKLLGVVLLPVFPGENLLLSWGILYCLSSIFSAFVLLYLVSKQIGYPVFRANFIDVQKLKQGFFFSLSESAAGINAQMDRAMLVSLANPMASGIYSAGYRFIDMGYIPIFAVQGASYPRFFKHGEKGIRGTLEFARKLLLPGIAYGLVTLVFLVAFSPFVPDILGEEFYESSLVLIWLSPIHILYIVQFLAADSLTGAGFQRSRSFVQVGAALLNISLNLYLIPIYSWKGAIWATLASEIFKSVLLWLIVWMSYRKARNA